MAILKSAGLLAAIKAAVPDIAQRLHQEYQEQITEVGAVKSGNLRDSQVTAVTDTTITTTWEADYAVYVHEGYSRKNGSRVEGRPWTKPVVDNIEASPAIADIAQKIQTI